MKAVDIGHELLRKKNAQAERAGMRVENVDAALDSRASGSTGKKRLIDQGARRMKSNAGDGCSSGDLRELGRSGNGSQRKIRAADFERALCLDRKHAAVGRSSQIGRGVIGSRSGELIRGA